MMMMPFSAYDNENDDDNTQPPPPVVLDHQDDDDDEAEAGAVTPSLANNDGSIETSCTERALTLDSDSGLAVIVAATSLLLSSSSFSTTTTTTTSSPLMEFSPLTPSLLQKQ
jgi:hypothetical protein